MRARVSGVMEHAYFESLARDERCDYCAGRRHVGLLGPDLIAIYCISLQEQPHRTAKAAAQFHALGLCREVKFYRPVRGRDADRAIWDSHRAVAQDAIAKGFARILVLEDDVLFTRPRETLVRPFPISSTRPRARDTIRRRGSLHADTRVSMTRYSRASRNSAIR